MQKIFIERKIGDHMEVSDDSTMSSSEILREFARKKLENNQGNHHGTGDYLRAASSRNGNDSILQVFGSQHGVVENQNQVNHDCSGDFEKGTISDSSMTAAEVLQMYTKKRQSLQSNTDNLPMSFDPRSLFTNSAKRVPQNSDVESDD